MGEDTMAIPTICIESEVELRRENGTDIVTNQKVANNIMFSLGNVILTKELKRLKALKYKGFN